MIARATSDPRARRVADDRREVDDRVGVAQRLRASRGIADVALDDPHAALAQLVREIPLAVQEHVQHRHVASGAQQLVHGQQADVARASRHQRPRHQRRASKLSLPLQPTRRSTTTSVPSEVPRTGIAGLYSAGSPRTSSI